MGGQWFSFVGWERGGGGEEGGVGKEGRGSERK